MNSPAGLIFNIQRYSTEDGPGIRTSVFFKGCPLDCIWCANPESKSQNLELVCRESQCIDCGKCLEACPNGVLSLSAIAEEATRDESKPAEVSLTIDHRACQACGACVDACPSGAMRFYGEPVSVDEVFDEVLKDAEYYRTSGGGVTVSGGEAMMQPEFVEVLFRKCKENNIHTTLDTCGYFDSKAFSRMSDCVDLVLYDIKLMDDAQHKKYTGVHNKRILENARLISELGIEMIIRVPLIPGITDKPENLTAIAEFVKSLSNRHVVNLLPYHNYGENKYKMLGVEYPLHGTKKQSKEQLLEMKEIFEDFGLECTVEKGSL